MAPGRGAALAVRYREEPPAAIVKIESSGLPRGMVELVAARLEKFYDIGRAGLVLHYSGRGPEISDIAAAANSVVDLVGAALGQMEPADLWAGSGPEIRVATAEGHTLAELSGDLTLRGGASPPGPHERLGGPLRTAFQEVELHLGTRGEPRRRYPVQVLCFGGKLRVVALGGEVPAAVLQRIGREYGAIVLARANSRVAYDPASEGRILETLEALIRRAKRGHS